MSLAEFLHEYDMTLLLAIGRHLQLTATALLIAIVISLPLGAWIAGGERRASIVLAAVGAVQTIPSIALFGLMIPILSLVNRGIGAVPATVALVLYSLLPIVRNTYIALRSVPEATVDAARGMGMSERQILLRISLPLSIGGIVAGVRTAATMSIGVAAIAAYIGAGGLGLVIERGIETNWGMMTLAGGVGVALLALVVEIGLEIVEKAVTPVGMKLASRQKAA